MQLFAPIENVPDAAAAVMGLINLLPWKNIAAAEVEHSFNDGCYDCNVPFYWDVFKS